MSLTISVIIEGVHQTKEKSEDLVVLEPHTGAVTLIQSGEKNILVDAGGKGTFPLIEVELRHHGLTPKDIDIIILTHFHLDHSFNVALFPNAKILGWKHYWGSLRTVRINAIEMHEVEKGVSVFPTPGHAEEHLAVLVTDETGKKTVIAGDAINASFVEEGRVSAFFYDEALYRESAQKIMEMGNEIVPGHGEIIQNAKCKIKK